MRIQSGLALPPTVPNKYAPVTNSMTNKETVANAFDVWHFVVNPITENQADSQMVIKYPATAADGEQKVGIVDSNTVSITYQPSCTIQLLKGKLQNGAVVPATKDDAVIGATDSNGALLRPSTPTDASLDFLVARYTFSKLSSASTPAHITGTGVAFADSNEATQRYAAATASHQGRDGCGQQGQW